MSEVIVPIKAEHFFVFYDNNGEISGISAHEHEAFDQHDRMKISYQMGEKFITGQLGIGQHKVDLSGKKPKLISIQINVKPQRIARDGFFQIDHARHGEKLTDITIRYKRGSSEVLIDLFDPAGVSERFGEISYTDSAVFYITKWNDPNRLIETIDIPMDVFLSKKRHKIDIKTPIDKISVFTHKCFRSYQVKERK